jgi:hypothetical protein
MDSAAFPPFSPQKKSIIAITAARITQTVPRSFVLVVFTEAVIKKIISNMK